MPLLVLPTRRLAQLTTVLALAAAVSLLPATFVPDAAAAVGNCTPDAAWPANRKDMATRVVELVNQHRAARGLRSLRVSATLTASAVWKARHMAHYRYMAHNDPAPPVGRTVGQRLAACGFAGAGWGENIANGYRTAEAVVSGWLSSPGHRANIERASYGVIGVGAAVSSNGAVYWAQSFGKGGGRKARPVRAGHAVSLPGRPARIAMIAGR